MTPIQRSDITPAPESDAERASIPLCATITDRALYMNGEYFTSEATLLHALCQPNLKCDICNMAGRDKCSCDHLVR